MNYLTKQTQIEIFLKNRTFEKEYLQTLIVWISEKETNVITVGSES